jgi:hypothetical protein
MKKLVITILMLLSSNTIYANESSFDSSISVGAGYQYGGVLGVRYNIVNDKHLYFGSLGLVGGALGYEYFLDQNNKHAIGLSVGSEVLTSENGFAVIVYEFYPSGFDANGWQLGVSSGLRREDSFSSVEGSIFPNKSGSKTKLALMFSAGYKF